MVVMNFELVGMGLMEMGMVWFWLVCCIVCWIDIIGFEYICDVQVQQCGILLIGIYFFIFEMGVWMFGMNELGIGVYCFNDNLVIDWLQIWGCLCFNKDMIDCKDLKGMIWVLKKGEVVWYVLDYDYGLIVSVFVLLFVVD